jgi:hypothetical protein
MRLFGRCEQGSCFDCEDEAIDWQNDFLMREIWFWSWSVLLADDEDAGRRERREGLGARNDLRKFDQRSRAVSSGGTGEVQLNLIQRGAGSRARCSGEQYWIRGGPCDGDENRLNWLCTA